MSTSDLLLVTHLKKQKVIERKKRKIVRASILTFLFLIEISVALVGGAPAAAVILPLAYAERGHNAFGGEWLIIFAATALSYRLFHRKLFEMLNQKRKELKGMAYYHQCPHCGSNLDPGESCDCQKIAVLSELKTATKGGDEIAKGECQSKNRGGKIFG